MYTLQKELKKHFYYNKETGELLRKRLDKRDIRKKHIQSRRIIYFKNKFRQSRSVSCLGIIWHLKSTICAKLVRIHQEAVSVVKKSMADSGCATCYCHPKKNYA